mmetsp:Transcript_48320/g.52232  ORF Transcript_48320/g.52232 Transcript_48320/m.52232 type:complete len:247 (-) Transcript_48320:203-943(-)
MGLKNKSSALLAAAENIIKYNNLYDRWIVTSTIEACIIYQYPDLDHDPNRLASSLAGMLPCCDEFSFPNSIGIYRWKWKKLSYWYFYNTTNDHDQVPAIPDNSKDRQMMVNKQASILQSIQTRTTTRSLVNLAFDNVTFYVNEQKRNKKKANTNTNTNTDSNNIEGRHDFAVDFVHSFPQLDKCTENDGPYWMNKEEKLRTRADVVDGTMKEKDKSKDDLLSELQRFLAPNKIHTKDHLKNIAKEN